MSVPLAILSGIIQGITEFFPISSSGHLVLLHSIFGLEHPQVSFDIFLHLGTLMSVLIFFRNDIAKLFSGDSRKILCIAIGSIPVAFIGLLFQDAIERMFALPRIVGLMLICTGGWLCIAHLSAVYRRRASFGENQLDIGRSFIVGVAQSAALIPGISRSGATIGTALMLGVRREEAFSFSFLLSVPAIAGVTLLKMLRGGGEFFYGGSLNYFAGGCAAMCTGILVLGVLSRLIKKNKPYIFGIYCVILGITVMLRIL